MVIQRINVWSAVKVAGVAYAILGLFVAGVATSPYISRRLNIPDPPKAESTISFENVDFLFGVGLIIPLNWFTGEGEGGRNLLQVVGTLLLFPILFGIAGSFSGLACSLLFNSASRMVGGLKVEFSGKGDSTTA